MSWEWAVDGVGYLDSADPGCNITTYPFTVFIWFKWEAPTGDDDCMWWISDSSVSDHHWGGSIGSAASDGIRLVSRGTTQTTATTTTDATASKWENALWEFVGDTERSVWLNNGGKATDITGSTPTGITKISIGMENDSSRGDSWEGHLAYFCVWKGIGNMAPNDRAKLHAGHHPMSLTHILDRLAVFEPLNSPLLNQFRLQPDSPIFTPGNQGGGTAPIYSPDEPPVYWPGGLLNVEQLSNPELIAAAMAT